MQVILLGELAGKGGEGDVIQVAQGYAENFLFPNKIALPATKGNLKQLEERMLNIEKRELARINEAQAAKEAVEGKTVKIIAKVGEEGQLFGAVTSVMIADAVLSQLGTEIDRKRVDAKGIKTAGNHTITINFYREISANITVYVGDGSAMVKEEVETAEAAATETAEVTEAAE